MAKKTKFTRTDVRGHNDALAKQARVARGGGFDGRLRRIFRKRIILLVGIFCFVIAVYAMNLIALQAAGNAYSVFEPMQEVGEGETITVTLQAPRGEIYDRNGIKLVTNATTYSLHLHHDAFFSSGGVQQRNVALLSLVQALNGDASHADDRTWQATLSPELFPFEGVYPDLKLSSAAADEKSEVGSAYRRTLQSLGREESSPTEIVQYYLTNYGLDVRVDGIPLYTNEQVTTLLRLYYNMDRCGFSPENEYLFATQIGISLLQTLANAPIPGMQITAHQTRAYPHGGYAAHLLGELSDTVASDPSFCNALGYSVNEMKGKSGCEAAFDTYLQGIDGEMQITYDTNGKLLSQTITRQAIAGQDVYLTLDLSLQIAAEDALRVNISTISNTPSGAEAGGCDAGAVVAADSKTGEILAMASYPTYDNIHISDLSEGEAGPSPYLNRVTAAEYTPAGLFHLCTAITGMDRGTLSPTSQRSDVGYFAGEHGQIVCPLYHRFSTPHGQLSLPTALCDGCSVYFATLGSTMEFSYLNAYARALGLSQPTGIEISEAVGLLSGDTAAPETLLPYAATGQGGTLSTPLQLCGMLSTLLQGGDRYALHLLQDVRAYVSGMVTHTAGKELLSRMRLQQEDCAVLRSAMVASAKANTLLSIKTADLQSAGVEVGFLGTQSASGTLTEQNALILSYGEHTQSGKAISICAVLEKGGMPSLASPTVAAILNAYFDQ
jgi:penicillin-binding protein 2